MGNILFMLFFLLLGVTLGIHLGSAVLTGSLEPFKEIPKKFAGANANTIKSLYWTMWVLTIVAFVLSRVVK